MEIGPDPVDLVRRLGGRAKQAELNEWTTRRQVRTAVARGRLVRAARGIYVLPALPEPERAAARARGVLSHASAARAWGLAQVVVPDKVHVTVPRGARPVAEPGVQVHWSHLAPHEVSRGVTSPVRTVLDCARSLAFAEALAIADSALAHSFMSQAQLEAAAAGCRGPGRARRLRLVRAADRRADNPFESVLRAILIERGVTGFVPQLPVCVGRRMFHVDLGDPRRRIVLEADSFTHHGTRAALVRDCERYDELVSSGWRVLRFAYEQVMFRPSWVGDMIVAVCDQAPATARGRKAVTTGGVAPSPRRNAGL